VAFEGLLSEVTDIAARYSGRADLREIIARSVRRKGMETADDLMRALPARTS
jgi:hypothetical protein